MSMPVPGEGVGHDDGSPNTGAVWILFLDSTGPGNVSVIAEQEISSVAGGFSSTPGYQEVPLIAARRFGHINLFRLHLNVFWCGRAPAVRDPRRDTLTLGLPRR